ncbi:hypothetical protein B0H11DRAFT_2347546 [Mycena galericulata]|nr:hypothetical protein B0H11DRAFT_2347546 [Mycena galericulata]
MQPATGSSGKRHMLGASVLLTLLGHAESYGGNGGVGIGAGGVEIHPTHTKPQTPADALRAHAREDYGVLRQPPDEAESTEMLIAAKSLVYCLVRTANTPAQCESDSSEIEAKYRGKVRHERGSRQRVFWKLTFEVHDLDTSNNAHAYLQAHGTSTDQVSS